MLSLETAQTRDEEPLCSVEDGSSKEATVYMPEAMLRCLMAKIDGLKATVTKQNEQLADLEMRLKTEMKTKERHLTSLIENISQSRSCSCKMGSNETDSLTMEPKKP